MTRVQKYRNTPKGNLTNTYHKQIIRNRDRGHGELPYTLEEFHVWALAQEKFHILFDAYLASGKDKDLVPSFDRDNNSKGYSFDNMTIMTWAENNEKDRSTHRAISVEQWSKDRTTRIAIFGSAKEAEETGAHRSKICEVCKGTRKSAGGFWWKYN